MVIIALKGKPMFTREEWNQRYEAGNTPWELGEVRAELCSLFQRYAPQNSRVLEVGCGIGTNAFWIAQQGHTVTAIDLSAAAVQLAKEKQAIIGTQIDFQVQDILQADNLLPPFPVIFSCAVLNQMQSVEQREQYVKALARHTLPEGYWLDITCSQDYAQHIAISVNAKAPPSLTATEIVTAVEPYFHIIEMRRVAFIIDRKDTGKVTFYAWASVFQKGSNHGDNFFS